MKFKSILAGLFVLGLGAPAHAGTMLYVQDSASTDDAIADVLIADGHSVSAASGGYNFATYINDDLTGDLSAYDAIFWDASNSAGSVHAAGQFTDLLTYVANGGFVFVTGYDSIADPSDPQLVAFLGGSSSTDGGGVRDPLAVTGANALSTGVKDIQGLSPTGAFYDWDTLYGLGADTACVAASSAAGGCQWSLRSLGDGFIAYIAAGGASSSVETAWANAGNDGSGAYNAALRNFAFNASPQDTAPEVPLPAAAILFPMGVAGLRLLQRRKPRQG